MARAAGRGAKPVAGGHATLTLSFRTDRPRHVPAAWRVVPNLDFPAAMTFLPSTTKLGEEEPA
jgi:hypothetical protein